MTIKEASPNDSIAIFSIICQLIEKISNPSQNEKMFILLLDFVDQVINQQFSGETEKQTILEALELCTNLISQQQQKETLKSKFRNFNPIKMDL